MDTVLLLNRVIRAAAATSVGIGSADLRPVSAPVGRKREVVRPDRYLDAECAGEEPVVDDLPAGVVPLPVAVRHLSFSHVCARGNAVTDTVDAWDEDQPRGTSTAMSFFDTFT
jgi:hypothetical protein